MSRTVYFIKPIGFDGPIKIGCSASPEGRRDGLELWSPFPLEIVAEIVGGNALEWRFHAKFEAQHVRREWFSPSDELLATIAAIKAGTFDIESLPAPKRLQTAAYRAAITRKWSAERRAAQARTIAERKAWRA